jgi:hypothetical protein
MGSFEYIDHGNEHLAVSMIKWSVVRRLIVSLFYKMSKPNMLELPAFVPAFELAVFRGNTRRRPIVLIHFADEQTAKSGWANILVAIRNHGLKGATEYVCNIRISLGKEFGNIYPEAM